MTSTDWHTCVCTGVAAARSRDALVVEAWYTALGHRAELYQAGTTPEQQASFGLFSNHLLGGIQWASGSAP